MKEETQESRSSLALWELYFNVVHSIVLTNMLVFKNLFAFFVSKKYKMSMPSNFWLLNY